MNRHHLARRLDMEKFSSIGIVKNQNNVDEEILNIFEENIKKLKKQSYWSKKDILKNFLAVLPEFEHKETGIYLDEKM